MYGTNDMQRGTIDQYRANLGMVLDVIEARDVVPIMSTIPPRGDGEPYATLAVQFNEVVRDIASTRHLPLIDLYNALLPLPGEGLGTDGIHPNTYNDPRDSYTDACDMSDAGLQFGYNMRNLTALQMLQRLRAY
jgi:lysophospholipase L1-like esterase